MKSRYHSKLKRFHLLWPAAVLIALFVVSVPGFAPGAPRTVQNAPLPVTAPTVSAISAQGRTYPLHTDIIASMFYVGESGSSENGFIPNRASTWDEQWQAHYGGVDDPERRSGWLPESFRPLQNPFYIALPYNDLDDNGVRKPSAHSIYWSAPQTPGDESLVKGRWVEVCRERQCAYGQWQDAGPFGEDDVAYVFGLARPTNDQGLGAGIDVSPAINDYLNLNGDARVTWRFIDATDIPPGSWKSW